MGFIISPFLSPFAFGFLVARARSAFPFPDGCFLLTIVYMSVGDGHMELAPCIAYLSCSLSPSSDVRRKLVYLHRSALMTPSRMYDRGAKDLPSRPAGGLRNRIETLVGVTGAKMAKYRATWYEAVSAPFKLFWRPHLLSIMVFEVHLFCGTEASLVVD
jgi:hypothetical protein